MSAVRRPVGGRSKSSTPSSMPRLRVETVLTPLERARPAGARAGVRGVRHLDDGEVTVVQADLDAHAGLEHLLSDDEIARATRFRRTIDRDRYVAARGLLRVLLGERLDEDPRSIRIVTAYDDKPRLGDSGSLGFNLAHSGGDALFAFTVIGDVGIDIEHVRPLDPVRLSRTCFSRGERAQLADLPEASRLEAFFDGWARKEAVVKADGRGVSLGLDSFTVTLSGPARLVEPPPGDSADRWSLMSIEAGPAVRAALAVRAAIAPDPRSYRHEPGYMASATSTFPRPATGGVRGTRGGHPPSHVPKVR